MLIQNLTVRFGAFTAVDDVTLEIPPGSIVGLVGESGSGKSTLARAVSGLVKHTGTVEGARRVQMVFQDPYASLDPRMTVGQSVSEAVLNLPRAARGAEVERLLGLVSLPAECATRYPRELSGGQRQRVAIARALAPEPKIIVCDEPVSSLDVSVQAQVLDLLADVQAATGVAYLFISHDLGVIHHMSDRVLVLNEGKVVETGTADDVFFRPREPYTQQLVAALPTIEPRPDAQPRTAVAAA